MTFEPTADDGADCMNVGVDAATLDAIGARFDRRVRSIGTTAGSRCCSPRSSHALAVVQSM
jgi:hypothetical protein